jgi:hypothetical protein
MDKITSPLDLFRQELAKLPTKTPTKGMWTSLNFVLTDDSKQLRELHDAVYGDGNGEKGLLRRMQIGEDATKVIQSDVRETLNMVRGQGGFLPKTTKEKLSGVGVDVLKVAAAAVLVWLLTDIFPRIFSIPAP